MKNNHSNFLSIRICIACLLCILVLVNPALAKQIALPNEIVFIPKSPVSNAVMLETTIYRPEGKGPFPLVIINHGKAFGDARNQERYRPGWVARYFLERNYVVFVPMREGFSKSGGVYQHAGCDVQKTGMMHAEDVKAAITYAHLQSYVDKSTTLLVGQSMGGLTTLAYGAGSVDPSVKGLINFAGGIKRESCSGWERNLINAVASYAKHTKVPSIWLYGDNDSYFSSATYHAMFNGYKASQPNSTLIAYGVFQDDSHKLFTSQVGRPVWEPYVEKFLLSIGLPTRVLNPQYRPDP